MRSLFIWTALASGFGTACWAARCTTAMDDGALREYQSYVAGVEPAMRSRFSGGELSWVPDYARKDAASEMAKGKAVRWNLTQPDVNRRMSEWNGAVVHWIGAIRIRGVGLEELKAVLQDYGRYSSIYRPMIYKWEARRRETSADAAYDVTFGLQNTYRAASVFPQHYSFEVRGRTEYSEQGSGAETALLVHLNSKEIRESDSGVPGRDDFLELHHDHGILWALNTYWRARRKGADLYSEFESITLARSVEDFVCRIGILPVPKAIVQSVMTSIPSESLELMLAATKAESERSASRRPAELGTNR